MFDFFRKKKKDYPAFWDAYLAATPVRVDKKMPIDKVRFVVFDTETTGLNPSKDKMLSIGAVVMCGNSIDVTERFECYVSQEEMNRDTIPIHGILHKGAYHKIAQDIAMSSFVEYIHGAVLVGHNVGFDVAIINHALQDFGRLKLQNQTLDTVRLAIRAAGLSPSRITNAGDYMLDTLCEEYNIPMSDRHTAAGDAFITAMLLMKLLSKLKKRGIVTLGDLLQKRRFL